MNSCEIHKKIKALRIAQGLTMEQLSQKTGIDQQKIGRLERNERKISIDDLIKITKALQVPIAAVIEKEITIDGGKYLIADIVKRLNSLYSICNINLSELEKVEIATKIYQECMCFSKEYRPAFISSLLDILRFIFCKDKPTF